MINFEQFNQNAIIKEQKALMEASEINIMRLGDMHREWQNSASGKDVTFPDNKSTDKSAVTVIWQGPIPDKETKLKSEFKKAFAKLVDNTYSMVWAELDGIPFVMTVYNQNLGKFKSEMGYNEPTVISHFKKYEPEGVSGGRSYSSNYGVISDRLGAIGGSVNATVGALTGRGLNMTNSGKSTWEEFVAFAHKYNFKCVIKGIAQG